MIKENSYLNALLRALCASLAAWPVAGVVLHLLWGDMPDGREMTQLDLLGEWMWTYLTVFPLMQGLLLGHFVFIYGLFKFAKFTQQDVHTGREVALVVGVLLVGFLLKVGAILTFSHFAAESYLSQIDSLVAITVVWATKSRTKVVSSLKA